MIIARATHLGVISHFFREKLSDINTTASRYKMLDDAIAGVTSDRHPTFNANDDLGIEATDRRKGHNKLFFDGFYEGTALPSLFASKNGYFLSDFSQYAYTLKSCFSPTSNKLERKLLDYSRKGIKVKMIGNLLGSETGSRLPDISTGFTSCVITRLGVPRFYVRNKGQSYYITNEVEETSDVSPWREDTGDICCSLVHCEEGLSDAEFKKVKESFMSITEAGALGSVHFVENSDSADLTAAKVSEINTYLSRTL